MDRHIEWFESIQNSGERVYYPIPSILNIDPIVKSYTTGGDEGHLYIIKVPDDDAIKIGSTTQLVIRMYYYPIGTELLYCIKVPDRLRETEQKWIMSLKSDSRFNLAHGREWFYGSWADAIDVLNDVMSGKYDDYIDIDNILAGLISDTVRTAVKTTATNSESSSRRQLYYGLLTGKRKSIRYKTFQKYGLQLSPDGKLIIPEEYTVYIGKDAIEFRIIK
jgi:hypothetical protein